MTLKEGAGRWAGGEGKRAKGGRVGVLVGMGMGKAGGKAWDTGRGRRGRTYDNRLGRRDISPRPIESDAEGGDGGDERGRKHSNEPHL